MKPGGISSSRAVSPVERADELRRQSLLHGCPSLEFDERLLIPAPPAGALDFERLRSALWAPLAIDADTAVVVAATPGPAVAAEAREALRVKSVVFRVALPEDVVRIIEHNQDLNPGFPPAGGRTPLARVRTLLAHRRLHLSAVRTALAKGRTGLAFLRTGLAFVTIALVLLRLFGLGWLLPLEALLAVAGVVMGVDGLLWYLPARRQGQGPPDCRGTEATWGTTVLEASSADATAPFTRSAPVAGAAALRADWNNLSPVMRRRFLASDRTDLAEERTTLACLRTAMARARTGLAFTRTGIAFIGLGIALLRQFGAGAWTTLDLSLIAVGLAMALEGFHWYLPGRRAGAESERSLQDRERGTSVWDLFFPPVHAVPESAPACVPDFLRRPSRPGIWGTTGLALERTVLADRRNVMARLRTVMARSRTGLAFVRTGMSVSAVGLGLLVSFGVASAPWTALDLVLVLAGFALIADGLYWHLPAEKIRRQFPYCFGDLEITLPDYGRPAACWEKVSFSHDGA
jgi:uncharacterized membrane protein YidH (DUF202 family)